jgi:ribosomal protein S18 acetylase RimI-like enzyme
MTGKEIIGYINDGANYYVSLFGKAEHMNCIKKDNYSYVFPKEDEKGIKFVYNVNIDELGEKEKHDIIAEIKSLNMPVWWDLKSVKGLYKTFFGKEGKIGTVNDEELYMAVLPGEEKIYKNELPNAIIKKVDNQELFKVWANHINDILSNGYPDIHPEYHYNLCRNGLMECYLYFFNNILVSSSTIMDNCGNASLEFVATKAEYRQRDFAKHICSHALSESFSKGVKIITVRAITYEAKELYKKLGFKIYNQMM